MEGAPSRTAIFAAILRGDLRFRFAPPWVLDDPFALLLVGPSWPDTNVLLHSTFGDEICNEASAFHCLRSRLAEDRLTRRNFAQYVILGAGLDSFVWRRPDLVRDLLVFEVDHPATQAWKRQRVAEVALPVSDSHFYVPIDFEVGSLAEGLAATTFDWAKPTMFSWLGVTHYLTTDAIEATLRTIAGSASGSEVVFDYRADDAILDENGRRVWEILGPIAEASGEPLQGAWSAVDIEGLLQRCGLEVADHPAYDDCVHRYFADRSDGLVPWTASGLVAARVR